MHGRIQVVRTPLPAESAIFVEGCNFQTKIFPRKGTRSLQKKLFFPRNPEKAHRSLHKTKVSPGKRILALEFSNFSGGTPPRYRNSGSAPVIGSSPVDTQICSPIQNLISFSWSNESQE
jgi:hypothetical protein